MKLIIRYGLVGISTTVLDIVLYNILTSNLIGLSLLSSHLVSSSAAIAVSFAGQRMLVFRCQQIQIVNQLCRFLLVTLSGVVLIQGVVLIAVERCTLQVLNSIELGHFGLVGQNSVPVISRNVAKGAALIVGILWNYIFFHRWVFCKQPRNIVSR